MTDGALIYTLSEGAASISDSAGNILFYTGPTQPNICTVFDASHDTMMNGDSLDCGFSSTQSVTIVPKPNSCDIYYIFTTAHECESDGLKYSEVDMSLNGGLGAVTVKNIPLYTPAAEKVAAVKHANGTDYWLVAHQCLSDTFLVYLITNAGVSPVPVKTGIGSVHENIGHGQLKFYTDGSKLANPIQSIDTVDLFDFDKSNGAISNAMSFDFSFNTQPYGAEFSPDQSKLYVGVLGPSLIWQFDLTAGNQAAINASKTLIGSTIATGRANHLQLGPDNKIYIAKSGNGYLAVINDPDSLGAACNFVENGFFLSGKLSRRGLPAIIPGYFGCGTAEGVEDIDSNAEITIYPNPTTGIFTVQGEREIEVYDLFGRLVLRSNKSQIDMGSYPKGIYIVRAGEAVRKLILR